MEIGVDKITVFVIGKQIYPKYSLAISVTLRHSNLTQAHSEHAMLHPKCSQTHQPVPNTLRHTPADIPQGLCKLYRWSA